MISWVVMLVSRLLDYVASVEDEAAGSKKHLNGKDRERSYTGTWTDRNTDSGPHSPRQNHWGPSVVQKGMTCIVPKLRF